MKYNEIPQIKVIKASTPEGFEQAFNREMILLAEEGLRLEVTYDLPNLTAFVHYTLDDARPETLAEKYEARHQRRTCGDCEHLERTDDRRVKRHRCDVDGSNFHRKTDSACNVLYEEIERRWRKC